MIRREHYPDGASGGGPLVVLYLTGDDRPVGSRRFSECWVTSAGSQLTDGVLDEHLSKREHNITGALYNEVLRAFDWCNAQVLTSRLDGRS